MRIRFDLHHYFEGALTVANSVLSTELSSLVSTLADKDAQIASLSTVAAGGDASVSAALSAA